MAKNKVKGQHDEELIDQDEVIYEEETGEGDGGGSDGRSIFEKYRNIFVIGGVAIAALVVFLVFQNRNKAEENLEGQVALINPAVNYERDSLNLAINGNGQVMSLVAVAEQYEGTDAGNLAQYYLGTALLQQGKIDEGIAELEAYEKGDNMVAAAAYAALGFGYEQKGDFAKAAEMYQTASETPEVNDFSTPFYLMHAARNFESAGNTEKALNVYQSIYKNHPNSNEVASGDVEKHIAKLGGFTGDE